MRICTIIRVFITSGFVSSVSLATRAHADFVEFDSFTSFLAATSAINATGSLNQPPTGPGYTWGSVRVSIAPGSSMGVLGGFDWSSRLNSEFGINGVENLDYHFAAPVFAAGFHFVEPELDANVNAPFIDSVFRITLLNGASVIYEFDASRPNDVASFIGVSSHLAFTTMQVREVVGGIDNEFFGEVYTSVIPAPGSAAMLVLILGMRRRTR